MYTKRKKRRDKSIRRTRNKTITTNQHKYAIVPYSLISKASQSPLCDDNGKEKEGKKEKREQCAKDTMYQNVILVVSYACNWKDEEKRWASISKDAKIN